MLRVYKWIGIRDEVIKLISNLMELWKTRLEIWSKGKKMTSRWRKVIHQLGFASPRYQYVDYYSRVGGTEWAHQETEMSVEHTAYLLMI